MLRQLYTSSVHVHPCVLSQVIQPTAAQTTHRYEVFVAAQNTEGCLKLEILSNIGEASNAGLHEGTRIAAVTRGALHWRRLVEEHFFSCDLSDGIVTTITFHSGMAALQWKWCPLVMIEEGWHPSLRVMAVRAGGLPCLRSELPAVRINVTALTFLGRVFELDFLCAGKRFMTRAAGHRSVSAKERKLGLAVIETRHLGP